MAKPNFILPNKPAIKAGSILSYNYTDDLKFAAEPLDFSRNGSATRVNEQGLIETTSANISRIDYSDSSTEPSLLLEPQSTNLITQSELFSTSWTRFGSITTTDNYTTSPSGQNNATRLQWTNAFNFIYQSLSHVGGDFTLSIYLKSNTNVSQNVKLFMDNSVQNKEVVVTTQWQRFEFTNTRTPTQSNRNVGLIKSGSQVGDLDISIYGAQFEQKSYPTSYIPTSGSAVTRLGETANNAGGAGVFNSEEGVLYAEIAALADSGHRWISVNSSNSSNRITIELYPQTGTLVSRLTTNGVQKAFLVAINIVKTNMNKIAVRYYLNNFSLWVNGNKISEDVTDVPVPIGLNSLDFKQGDNSGNFYGKTKNLKVFNYALTDEELQTLTT